VAPVRTPAPRGLGVPRRVASVNVHRDISPDDLTTFLAGDCSPEEGAAIGRAVACDPWLRSELVELAAAVATLRDAAGFLTHVADVADEATSLSDVTSEELKA
jgi:hypothetical protein